MVIKAVGLDREGTLYLIEVDGQENIYKGMDLYEFTDLILSLGIYNAVNVDGIIINHYYDYMIIMMIIFFFLIIIVINGFVRWGKQ